jgi:hypothetical protein
VLLQVRAAPFHLDQYDRFPDQIGEGDAALVGLGHAHFEGGPGGSEAIGPAEGLEQMIQEDLRLALFVAGEVLLAPADELGEFLGARHGAGLPKGAGTGNA